MSRGSPIVPLRINQELLDRIDAEIGKINERRKEEPYCRSTFILTAVRDKLAHLDRSRGPGKAAAAKKKIKKQFDKDNLRGHTIKPWTGQPSPK